MRLMLVETVNEREGVLKRLQLLVLLIMVVVVEMAKLCFRWWWDWRKKERVEKVAIAIYREDRRVRVGSEK